MVEDELVQCLSALTPPVNVPLHLYARAADDEILSTARRLSDAVEDGLSCCNGASHCSAEAREVLAKYLQNSGKNVVDGDGSGSWCIPVVGVAGAQGVPLLAVGCRDQIHVLSNLDGENDLEIVCCLQPRAGRVLALEWSYQGQRLACCCEKEILVYSPRPPACGGAGVGGDSWSLSTAMSRGIEWYVSHRAAAPRQSSISWSMLGQDTILLAGGSSATAWKVTSSGPADVFANNKPISLIPVHQGKRDATAGPASASSSPDSIDWGLRGAAGHHQLSVSPDACWVASCPAFGRVVSLKKSSTSGPRDSLDDAFSTGQLIMLPHPRSVLSIEWLPRLQREGTRGTWRSVNVLVTCCSDGVARVWKELKAAAGGGDWSQTFPQQSAGQTESIPGLPGGSFVLAHCIGDDPLSQSGIRAELVVAASWVINVVPGYATLGGHGSASKVEQENLAHEDDGNVEKIGQADAVDSALLTTVTSDALCLWSITGLASGQRRGIRVSCIHRSDLARHSSSAGLPCVKVQAFRTAVSPDFSVDTGDRARLMIAMIDARGVMSSGVIAIGPHSSNEVRAVGTYETVPQVVSTGHREQAVFLSEGHSDFSVLCDRQGAISFWWWDISSIGRASRHHLSLAGWFEAGDDLDAAACDGFKLLISCSGRKAMRFMELRTFSPTGMCPRVEPQEEIICSHSNTDKFKTLSIIGMTSEDWLCVVALAEGGSGKMWCGGALIPKVEDSATFGEEGLVLQTAVVVGEIRPMTCIHVPDCKSSRDFRQSHVHNSAKDGEFGFFFTGDHEGFVHLFCVRFSGESSSKVDGSVCCLSSFGDRALGEVLHIRAQALGCVAIVHSGDPNNVHIWKTAADGNAFYVVGNLSIPGLTGILSLAWFEPVPLFPLLAVATETSVYVLSRSVNSIEANAKSEWVIRWGTSLCTCSSITWTADGRILASCAGGVFALQPLLTMNQRGAFLKPAALVSHTGFSLCPGNRSNLGSASSGLQILHETLQDMLVGLSPLHPKVLHLHWNAGHLVVLDKIVEHIFDIVSEDGAGARIGEDIGTNVFDLVLDSDANGKANQKVDTASNLATEGFDVIFGSSTESMTGPSGTQSRCKQLIDMMDRARQEQEPVSDRLWDLKPIFVALHAALAGSDDRLDKPAENFTFAVKLHDANQAGANRQPFDDDGGQISRMGMMRMVDMAWALLSGEQDTLLRKLIPEEPRWDDIRFIGAPLWISSPTNLKAMAERLSKSQFKMDRDPTQCALIYLCLDKKTTLTAMFKMVKNDTLHKFFCRDFTEDQNKAAAIKNACTLLSQHRFSLAAAFFMLGGNFDDAFATVLNKMDDPMLALLIARLYCKTDSGPIYEKAMKDVLSKWRSSGENVAASLILWRLSRFHEALQCLAESGSKGGGCVVASFELVRVLSVYTWMRSDPRLRLAAAAAAEASGVQMNTASDEQAVAKEDDGNSAGAVLSVVEMLQQEARLRQAIALEFVGEGLIEFAMEQCNLIGQLHNRIGLERQGMSMSGLTMLAQEPQHELSTGELGKVFFEKFLYFEVRCAVVERLVRASLIFTPDFVHPATLQQKDPEKVAVAFSRLSDALAKAELDVSPLALIGSALHESAVRTRLDCYTSLSLSAGTASEGFAFLTLTSLAIPEALRSLPSITRTSFASSYFLRLAQRFTRSGSIMAEAAGQPSWLGDCLHLDALHRRICLATFLCTFMAFWHSYDTAGLQLLLCGMWDERASKSCDSAMALSSYAQRALTRLSLLHRCEWARIWARYEKQVPSLHASSGMLFDQPYSHERDFNCGEALRARMLDLLLVERMGSLLSTAASFGRSDDDVCIMVSVAAEAFRKARERITYLLHGVATQIKLNTLATALQPYLNPSGTPASSDSSLDEGAVGHLRKHLLACDDRARIEMHKAALAVLAHSPMQSSLFAKHMELGKIEVLLSHRGEVFRSLCVRSDDRSGSVLSVCSNKSIREVNCRPDAVSVVGAGREGLAAVLVSPASTSALASTDSIQEHGGRTSNLPKERNSGEVSGVEVEGISAQHTAASMMTAVDGVLEMLWDKVSSSAAEVVHSVAEAGSHGSLPGGIGAMALAAHPWLPVFVSGGPDGSVLLWGFGAPQPLSSFGSMSGGLVNRMRFDEPGAKFCACDSTGLAAVWNFELARGAGLDRRPVDMIQAHSKRCYDICFLDQGTILGTAGSGSALSVCVWDLLMPPSSSCAAALNLHDGAANSFCYYEGKHLLISGGHKGDICVTDTRTWRCMRTVHSAHKLATRALCFSPGGGMVVSGSTDGDIKFWDVEDLVTGAGEASPVITWTAAHEKGTFVGTGSSTPLATYGVMDVQFSRQGNHLISCGADGRLLRRSCMSVV